MTHRFALTALVLTAVCGSAAHATDVPLAADGRWSAFTVDDFVGPSFDKRWIDFADGSALGFSFNVPAGMVGLLTVVDAGFAGDTFSVSDAGAALGATSGVPASTVDGAVALDFDGAFADPAFSRGVFTLSAGAHRITGRLEQSVSDGGVPLDATEGAVRLTLAAAVPEPSTTAMLIAGLGVVGFVARRRA